jgi:hypothetical protein
MIENIPFLINNSTDLNLLCSFEEQDFKDFLKRESELFLNKIDDEFENEPNFDGKRNGYLKEINSTKKFINNLTERNDKYELIVAKYESTYNLLQSKFNNNYLTSLCLNLIAISSFE